uniref:PKD domain-containing protein n=1 Tax=Desulfatirhabdium butyrativorans TaxID=340467 RepID=A0A7C4RPJ6_9BACT
MKQVVRCWMALMVFVFVASGAYGETVIHKLGVRPFWKPPLKSVTEFRTMIQKSLPDLKKGFEMANALDVFEVFVNQGMSSTPEEILVQPGSKLQWMIFKDGKKVKLVRDAVWKGKEPFKAYRLKAEHQGKQYVFVIPWDCGNVSLEQVVVLPPPPAPKPAPAPAPAPPANQSPTCHVTISPETVFTGESIVVDASKSSDSDGSIASMQIQVKDADNRTVQDLKVDKPPFVQSFSLNKGGNYTVHVTVTDNKGASSSQPGCAAKTVRVNSRGRFTADAAVLYQDDPATFLPVRIGYEWRFNNRFSLLGMVGMADVIHGNDDSFSVLGDLTALYRYNRFFVGTGVGLWHSDRNDRFDFILNTGYMFWGDPNDTNLSVFVEGRSAFDEFNDLEKYGRIGGGLRLQF